MERECSILKIRIMDDKSKINKMGNEPKIYCIWGVQKAEIIKILDPGSNEVVVAIFQAMTGLSIPNLSYCLHL